MTIALFKGTSKKRPVDETRKTKGQGRLGHNYIKYIQGTKFEYFDGKYLFGKNSSMILDTYIIGKDIVSKGVFGGVLEKL